MSFVRGYLFLFRSAVRDAFTVSSCLTTQWRRRAVGRSVGRWVGRRTDGRTGGLNAVTTLQHWHNQAARSLIITTVLLFFLLFLYAYCTVLNCFILFEWALDMMLLLLSTSSLSLCLSLSLFGWLGDGRLYYKHGAESVSTKSVGRSTSRTSDRSADTSKSRNRNYCSCEKSTIGSDGRLGRTSTTNQRPAETRTLVRCETHRHHRHHHCCKDKDT